MTFLQWARRTKYSYQIFIVVVLILVPFIIPSDYFLRLAIYALIYFILALGYNVVITMGGQFHLGFIAFYAIGGYTSALLALHFNLSFWITMPLAGVMAVLTSLLLGIPTFRFRGDYLCIVTLGFAEIVRVIALNWDSLTHGPRGLPGIPPPRIFTYEFDTNVPYYFLILIMAFVSLAVYNRLHSSRVGLAWAALRDDEVAANAMGISTTWYKQTCCATGACMVAFAGAFYAHYLAIITPATFVFWETLMALAIVLLSGGHPIGMFGAAIVIVAVPESMRVLVKYRMLIMGLFFIAAMLYKPEGFVFGKLRHFSPRKGELDQGRTEMALENILTPPSKMS
jgi:branched-chain amino acid transport system permease protein